MMNFEDLNNLADSLLEIMPRVDVDAPAYHILLTSRSAVLQLIQQLSGRPANEMQLLRNEIAELKRQVETANKQGLARVKIISEQNNAKLMSVFYMLGTLEFVGTHREKRTIIMALKATVEKLVVKGDTMQLPDEYFAYLPF